MDSDRDYFQQDVDGLDIFKHVNVWLSRQGGRVVSACPGKVVTESVVKAYADSLDSRLDALRAFMPRRSRLHMWDMLREHASFSFRDHIFFFPQGYHQDDTVLVVLDTAAVEMVPVLRIQIRRST